MSSAIRVDGDQTPYPLQTSATDLDVNQQSEPAVFRSHGETLKPAEPVVSLYPSANRDEAAFENADEFRWDRARKHVAFGNGRAACRCASFSAAHWLVIGAFK